MDYSFARYLARSSFPAEFYNKLTRSERGKLSVQAFIARESRRSTCARYIELTTLANSIHVLLPDCQKAENVEIHNRIAETLNFIWRRAEESIGSWEAEVKQRAKVFLAKRACKQAVYCMRHPEAEYVMTHEEAAAFKQIANKPVPKIPAQLLPKRK